MLSTALRAESLGLECVPPRRPARDGARGLGSPEVVGFCVLKEMDEWQASADSQAIPVKSSPLTRAKTPDLKSQGFFS